MSDYVKDQIMKLVSWKEPNVIIIVSIIDNYAKDGGEELLPRCIAFELRMLNDCMGIRLENAVDLGRKFLAAIFSVIVYSRMQTSIRIGLVTASPPSEVYAITVTFFSPISKGIMGNRKVTASLPFMRNRCGADLLFSRES